MSLKEGVSTQYEEKILASLLLSTVMVSQAAVLTTAHAETTDDKIAAQDNKISNLTAQQREAQNKLIKFRSKYLLFKQSNQTCNLKMIDYKQNLKSLRVKLQNFLRILYLVMIHCKNRLVVLKQMELQQTTSIQL